MHEILKLKDASEPGLELFRVSYASLKKGNEELYWKVILLRNRVKELDRHFRRDAKKARRLFYIVLSLSVAVGLAVICYGLYFLKGSAGDFNQSFALLIGAAVAVIGAVGSSLGFHRQYHAMFAASWATRALSIKIDQVVYMVSAEAETKGIAAIEQHIIGWTEELSKALSSFGDNYGASLIALTFPGANFGPK